MAKPYSRDFVFWLVPLNGERRQLSINVESDHEDFRPEYRAIVDSIADAHGYSGGEYWCIKVNPEETQNIDLRAVARCPYITTTDPDEAEAELRKLIAVALTPA
jgi:hypothetical protein